MKKLIPFTILLLVLLMTVPASADPMIIEPGYSVEVFLTGLVIPHDLIFNTSGDLFVTETDLASVSMIEILPDGTAGDVSTYGSEIPDAEGVSLDASDVVFVSDFDAVYKVIDGFSIPFVSGFSDAEGLAFDQLGDLFVSDDVDEGIRISKIDILEGGSAGELSTFAIIPGGNAASIAFDANGDLFVADNEDEVWRINILPDGSVAEIVPYLGDLITPYGLEFDKQGNLYVGSSETGDIWKIDPDGNATLFATGLASATGLAFDSQGNLFVTEWSEGRILRIVREFEPVSIDIKPGSYPNSINLANRGVVPVAVLTTDNFNVLDLDPVTVTFAGAAPLRWALEDVDFDGDYDLAFHFKTQELDLFIGDTEATLMGETFSGQFVQGTDTVNLVP